MAADEFPGDARSVADYIAMMPGAYRHIGVASTFSPRFQAVLAEADRYARSFESPLSVIHAAAEHSEAIERFFIALERLDRVGDTGLLWSVADTPAARDAAERDRRQAAAERAIEEDPLVRALMSQYKTARIVPGSVKPLPAP